MALYEVRRQDMLRGQLVARGIRDARVLDAMGALPRHEFVPEPVREVAYEDRAVPIGERQTLSQPYVVALMLEALCLEGNERVLEIGTGSGYVTVLLSKLASMVYTIERNPTLFAQARAQLERCGGPNIERRMSDGSLGWPDAAPFDRIIAGAGAPDIPKPLLEQLKVGGVMVLPVGSRRAQWLVRVVRQSNGFTSTSLCSCVFVPLVGECAFKAES